MHFLGGDQREAIIEVKAHLVAENALGTGAGAVGLEHAMAVDMAQKVFILGAHRVRVCGCSHAVR